MPYQPRQTSLVQPASTPDPMQTLSGMMSMARQFEGYEDEQKQRKKAKSVEDALNGAHGDPEVAAGVLEKAGDWVSGKRLRDNAREIRLNMVNQADARINEHKTFYGQASQILTELGNKPVMYPDMRARLADLAAQVDPAMAKAIPQTYDPT